MNAPPTGTSAHVDPFVRESLPPKDTWPTLLYELPALRYAPQTNVVSEILDAHVLAGRGDAPCLVGESFSWSYKDLLHAANRMARVLVEDLDVVPGARVMLRAPNTPTMVAAWMAVAKSGAVVVATMPLLRSRELAVIADKARIRLALVDERLSEEMEKLASESREIQ
ncbi:MAG TPA: AMP-binding protein, partial [Vicinamibacteria bacterium]|nr:AMP-binding protein [Vicinamibacteria bacterium]